MDGLGRVLFGDDLSRSDEEIVTPATPEERLRPMPDGVVVLGHTHMQLDRVVGATRVVNAGASGCRTSASRAPTENSRPRPRAETRERRSGGGASCAIEFPGAEDFARENVLTTRSPDEATEAFKRIAEERAATA